MMRVDDFALLICMNNAENAHFYAQHMPGRREELEVKVWEHLLDWAYLKDIKEGQTCS